MYCSQFWKLKVPNQSVGVWEWPTSQFTFPWPLTVGAGQVSRTSFVKMPLQFMRNPPPVTSPRPCHLRPACGLQHKHFEGTLAQGARFLSWTNVFSRAQSSRSSLCEAHGFIPFLPRRLFHCWSDDVYIFLWRWMFFLILYFLGYLLRFGGEGTVWSKLQSWLCAHWGHHCLCHSDDTALCCCCLVCFSLVVALQQMALPNSTFWFGKEIEFSVSIIPL